MLTIENIEKIVGEKIPLGSNSKWGTIEDVHIRSDKYVFFMVVKETTTMRFGMFKTKQYENQIQLNRVPVSNWDDYYELSLDGYIGKITINKDKILNRKQFVEIMGEMVEVIVMSKTKVGQIR